jgi:nucleoid DNA-binding protein
MEELLNKITAKAGISNEQAVKALDAVKDYVKEKFPMMADAVDKLFASENKKSTEDYLD